ncbi:MAG: type II secretion system protein [Cyanobacteria bacterium J06643_13]
MNNVFTAKLLQNLRSKKGDKGFTLIELLVVVIIIGVLAAVALPNLLSQVGKARETEIKNAVGTINRAQQAFHFERQNFGANSGVLGVTIQTQYIDNVDGTIDIATAGQARFSPANAQFAADGTRAYGGNIAFAAGQYESAICQTNIPAAAISGPPVVDGDLATAIACSTPADEDLVN